VKAKVKAKAAPDIVTAPGNDNHTAQRNPLQDVKTTDGAKKTPTQQPVARE